MNPTEHSDLSITGMLADYIARCLDSPLPNEVIEKAKHHLLDTAAAMVSGSVLPAGQLALRYVNSQGGVQEASVVGTRLKTSTVNAALANGMMAHSGESDDSHPLSITHPGCAVVPAALAMAELGGHNGDALLKAIVLGYDIATRTTMAVGVNQIRSAHRSTHAIGGIFGAGAAAGALARLPSSKVRYLISYIAQQASGLHCWVRDKDHIEKAFDFGGMPARNGVAAATMVEIGMTGVEDALDGDRNFFSAFSPSARPNILVERLGERFEILETNIKKWSVGSPIQAVLDALSQLIADHALTSPDIAAVEITIAEEHVRVVSDNAMPSVCVEHLAALMIADGHLSYASCHDTARMNDPRIQDVRRRIVVTGSPELGCAQPRRQAIVAIAAADGRKLRHHARVVRGTADDPMSRHEVAEKALELIGPVLGSKQADELLAIVWSAENLPDVRKLCRHMQV